MTDRNYNMESTLETGVVKTPVASVFAGFYWWWRVLNRRCALPGVF